MIRSLTLTAAASLLLLTGTLSPAIGLEPAEQRGLTFARTNCAMCHAIGKTGRSPLSEAPRFCTLHERYPVEDLAEPLAEGLMTGHPSMPEWRLDPGQIADLIAYLKTLAC